MAYKDGAKSGGRVPGSKNRLTLLKATIRAEAIAKVNEAHPDAFNGDGVDFLQAIYRSPEFDADMRMEAATPAAAFERPKKSESTIDDKRQYVVRMPPPVTDLAEWKKLYAQDAEPSQEMEARLKKLAEKPAATTESE